MSTHRVLTIEEVERALRAPLPGWAAQARMGTRPRSTPAELGHIGPPRQGAVLILLYPYEGQLYFPLTRRTDRVANHKGQISLPGGAQDPEDSSFWDTALRETFEEIGVEPARIRRIAALSVLYIPASHFEIYPFVGYVPARPCFAPDATEVAEIIEFPLQALLDPSIKDEETWSLHGRQTQVPFYRYGEHVIWGATAMVLSEFEVMLSAWAHA